jgi:glycosyltransferase involved in cell wall biosynthesis
VHLITGLDVGGAELALARLVGGLRQLGVQSVVISITRPGLVGDRIRAEGVRVVTLGVRRGAVAPHAILRLRRVLADLEPDVLQTWMYHADLLGTLSAPRRRRPALVWNVRASNVEMKHYRWLSRATRRACVWFSRRPRVVVANSYAGVAFHEGLGYRPARWIVIPNGIDVAQFRPDPIARGAIRAELGIPPAATVLGLIARADPMKGHDVFLPAAAELLSSLPSLHVLLAGEGVRADAAPFAAWLDRLAPGERERVHLLGLREDMPAINAALDVACSVSRFGEGFPNAIAEAMACGVPVVSTDVGDAAHVVGESGFIVPPDDAPALAARCRDLLTDRPRRCQLGQAARNRIERQFGYHRVVQAYERLYRELSGTPASPSGSALQA